jgi:hypothetical protein
VWCGSKHPERDEAPYVRVFGAGAGREVLDATRFGELALRVWRPLLDAESMR